MLQSVSYIAGALGVCLAMVYYVLNLRITQRNQELTLKALEQSAKSQQQSLETRQIQALLGFNQEVASTLRGNVRLYLEIMNAQWDSFDDFYHKYSQRVQPEQHGYRMALWNRYNVIGLMIRDGMIDVKSYVDYMHDTPVVVWEKYRDIILEYRKRYHLPNYLSGFEFLAEEINRYRVRMGWGLKTPDDLPVLEDVKP